MDSDNFKTAEEFTDWLDDQKSRKQNQRESNIAKKAKEKAEMVFEARRANELADKRAQQQQEILVRILDTFNKIASTFAGPDVPVTATVIGPSPEEQQLAGKVEKIEAQIEDMLKMQATILETLLLQNK